MIYRTAGMIEAAVSVSTADKVKQAMQVLEEYAIESSISKVVGSETLDFCVDEGLQILGGYGFHEDYPMARAYRDSRINRIFEGTNEINRMLIIQMLVKRAMAGVLPLIPAAKKLADELLSGPAFEESPTGALAEEEKSLAQAKKVFLLAAGTAVEKFRDRLADQQEIVAFAFEYRDGYLRHGIRAATCAKIFRGRQASIRRDGGRRSRLHLRRDGPHRKGSSHSAQRDGRRRHSCNAARSSQASRKARARRYHRASPARCRRRARAGPLSIRGPLKSS